MRRVIITIDIENPVIKLEDLDDRAIDIVYNHIVELYGCGEDGCCAVNVDVSDNVKA